MNQAQQYLVTSYAIFALIGFIYGLYKVRSKNDNLGEAHVFNLIGAFVWADAVVFGLFWTLTSTVVLLLNDWVLFLLTLSLFWTVRSLGEVTYWFNQQFSKVNRNPARRLWINKIFNDEYTTWFAYQIQWQCTLVIFLILSIYLTHKWLLGM